ncbi:MAG: AsmA-like C-terminal region-containing protein, partial [Pseudomonadota bacterium]
IAILLKAPFKAPLKSNDWSVSPGGSSVPLAASNIAINGLSLTLDDVQANGSLALDMSGAKPTFSGDLTTSALDLTPFMGPPPENQPEGWSKEPLALDSLSLADGTITLKSPSIKIDKVSLEDADLTATLQNGRFVADITQVKTFGGRWQGEMTVNARSSVPGIGFDLSGQSILIDDLLRTLTGTDRLSGIGEFSLNATGEGASIHDIMQGLDGQLSANLADGALKGVNLGQLFRTTTNLRQSLAAGDLSLGLSPGAETDFTSFVSLLTIRDGVANVDTMEFVNPVLGAIGSGRINLGAQTLDMGIQFAADTGGGANLNDIQLNGMPIPLKITGSWASPRVVPDTAALTRALVGGQLDQVENTARDAINEALGDDVGSIIGDVIGGQRNRAAPEGGEEDAADDEEEEEPATPEDVVEDIAREALGGIFGRRD